MTSSKPRIPAGEKWIAAGLIVLALVPSIAGGLRIGEVADGAMTSDNARFLDDPLPVVLHICGSVVYAFLGAFQFLPTFRRRFPSWHTVVGRYVLVPAGIVVAVTGLWMTAVYDVPEIDKGPLQVSRWIVGVAMLAFIVMALVCVERRDFRAHGAWMIRAYALAAGAGTQVFTSIPFVIVFGDPDLIGRLVQMDAAWVINALVAELVIRQRSRIRPRVVA